MSEEPRWQRPKVPSGTQTGNYVKVTILVDSEMPKEGTSCYFKDKEG